VTYLKNYVANSKVLANISYSKDAEIGSKYKVYFAECGDRSRGKTSCCLSSASCWFTRFCFTVQCKMCTSYGHCQGWKYLRHI